MNDQQTNGQVVCNIASNLTPGAPVAAKKVPKPASRTSNFFVTINTNQQFLEGSDEEMFYARKFKDFMEKKVLVDPVPYITFMEGDPRSFKRYFVEAGIERGPTNGKIHAHFMLKTLHNGKIKINRDALSKIVCEGMGLKGVHIDFKAFSSNDTNLLDYIRKMRNKIQV